MSLAHIDQNQSLTAHIALDHGAILRALNINVNDPKAQALILACEKYGLDPLLKHAVLISGNLYVTRDGLLAIAHRDGRLDGIVIEEEGENAQEWWAKVTVHVKGMSHGFTYRGRYPKDGQQKKYGPEMAVKCAEVMALRRAFGVTGIPTMEEQWDVLADTGSPLASPEQVARIDSLLPVVPEHAMPALKAWKAEQGISMKAGEFTAEHADMVVAKLEELAEVSGGGEPSSPPAAAPGVRTGGEEIGGASLVDPANPCTDPSGVSPAPDRQAPAATTTVEPDTLLGDEVGTAPPAGTAPGGGKNVTGGGSVPPTATPSGGTPTAAVLLSATGKTAGSAVVALKRAAAEVDPAGPFMADEIEAVPEFAARVLAHLGGMPIEGTPSATYTKKQNGWIHAVWANHGGDNARKAYLSQLTSGRTDSSTELTAAEKKAYLTKTEEMA